MARKKRIEQLHFWIGFQMLKIDFFEMLVGGAELENCLD